MARPTVNLTLSDKNRRNEIQTDKQRTFSYDCKHFYRALYILLEAITVVFKATRRSEGKELRLFSKHAFKS